jgi:hypothetical protein
MGGVSWGCSYLLLAGAEGLPFVCDKLGLLAECDALKVSRTKTLRGKPDVWCLSSRGVVAIIYQSDGLELGAELALQDSAREVGIGDLFGGVRIDPLVVLGKLGLGVLYAKLVVVLQQLSAWSCLRGVFYILLFRQALGSCT